MYVMKPATLLMNCLNLLQRRESGQTLVEYSLLIAMMSIALVGVLTLLGSGTNGLYGTIEEAVNALIP
jgi:Flp pilus assembly pilin Flp